MEFGGGGGWGGVGYLRVGDWGLEERWVGWTWHTMELGLGIVVVGGGGM